MTAPGKITGFLIILVFIVFGCTQPATKSGTQRNLADVYNPGKSTVHPDFFIQHVNDSSSVIYIRVYPTELLFNQANEQGKSLARIRIFYELRELIADISGGLFVDTVSVRRTLNKDEVRNSFFSGLPIKASLGKKYSLKVEVTDEIRNTTSQTIIIVDKISRYSDQNFKVLSATTGYPSFTRYFAPGEYFRLQLNQLGLDSIYVDYYSLDRTLPRPAFSSAPEIPMKTYPDTSFAYYYTDSTEFSMPVQGIYHFRMKKEVKEGLSLFNFGESFPLIKTPDDLLGPLVYLTSSSEFRDIRMESNRKLAIDNFWLKLNPDVASSRELIRVFYNRVFYSNLYFSSYKEGWKTDRGMIYIIFGPPRMLEKTSDMEKWTYFSKKGGNTAVFEFKRNENQFTNLDYQLLRTANSGAFWREATGAWRNGKVYSIDF
jgi:GWxTD domain-containing protein